MIGFFGLKYPICDCSRSNQMPLTGQKNSFSCANVNGLPSNISTMPLVAYG